MSTSQTQGQGRNKNMTWEPKLKKKKIFKRHYCFLPSLLLQLITCMKIIVIKQIRWLQYNVKNSLCIPFDSFIFTTNGVNGARKSSCS